MLDVPVYSVQLGWMGTPLSFYLAGDSGAKRCICYAVASFTLESRRLFRTTETLEKAIAAAAMAG